MIFYKVSNSAVVKNPISWRDNKRRQINHKLAARASLRASRTPVEGEGGRGWCRVLQHIYRGLTSALMDEATEEFK